MRTIEASDPPGTLVGELPAGRLISLEVVLKDEGEFGQGLRQVVPIVGAAEPD